MESENLSEAYFKLFINTYSMYPNYVAILVFAFFAVFVPASMIIGSMMIRKRRTSSQVAELNFESGEESVGSRITIMKEYFHYFSLFLFFEILVTITLFWVIAARSVGSVYNYFMLAFLVAGFLLEIIIVIYARKDSWVDE